MKTTDLPTTPLPKITFVLSRDHSIYEFPLSSIVQNPEDGFHESETVAWFLDVLDLPGASPLVIYTLKDTLVNLCGQLVERGALKPDDVQVLIVEGDDVKVYSYNEDGVLHDWPFGWFMWDADILTDYLHKHNLSSF